MSRPGSSHTRPTHIAMPTGGFAGRSPNSSPRETPASPASPRSSFLPNFMRTRSRAATVTNSSTIGRLGSPSAELSNPLDLSRPATSREASTGPPSRESGTMTRSVSTPQAIGTSTVTPVAAASSSAQTQTIPEGSAVKTHRIRLVPHLENSRSLAFDPVIRELMPIRVPAGTAPSVAAAAIGTVGPAVNGRPPALVLKIGRFTDKSAQNAATNANTGALAIAGGGGDVCSGKVAFRSKVVSRAHAEIWCEADGKKFFIRDSASSSGTFLNHIRLSSPNTESRPTALKDGDILQLGVDYQGGIEDMFRCVKMRVELGREWQRSENEFNKNALKQLKALGGEATPDPKGKGPESTPTRKGKASVTDCCICLFSVTVCQSLFIAPCSHVFHYKCIRPLLVKHHPGFSCPLCRTFANLEEDVETEDAWEVASRRASLLERKSSGHSIRIPQPDRSAEPGTSSTAGGNPGTGIAVGDSSRSIGELLGDEGNPTSEEVMEGSQPLQREATAVPPETAVDSTREGLPSPVQEEEEPNVRANQLPSDIANGSSGFQIPARALDTFGEPVSEVQTPMNDTFLATLAPSVHQRLDLARQMSAVGRAATPVEEEEGNSNEGGNSNNSHASDEGWQRVERDRMPAEIEAARRDMEMMFT